MYGSSNWCSAQYCNVYCVTYSISIIFPSASALYNRISDILDYFVILYSKWWGQFAKVWKDWSWVGRILERVFLGVDYYLLLTFIALFVLIGNLQSIPFFNSLFKQWIIGNEVIFGIISSQVISNVPAAILLSGFSSNYESIIVGINIGD